MTDHKIILLLKISMMLGLGLLLFGIYFDYFSHYMESSSVTGIVIGATCISLGLLLSIPTKMYLTIILMKRERKPKKTK